ncbi:MAG TPA: dephospho-CoA kinase [bacterium]|nr:dephospho-CoA kinase [bacterium]
MEPGHLRRVKKSKLIVVGITGIFGSGKTTAACIFKKEGIPCFSLDAIVHALFKKTEIIEKIKELFGEDIIKRGRPDRKAIAKIVFTDRMLRKKLEDVIHPHVFDRFKKIIFDYNRKGGIIVFEIPLLFETKSESFFDKIIVVSASHDKILSRLKEKFSSEDINNRLAAQTPLREKEKKATYVIFNSGSICKTTAQVKQIIKELRNELI